MADTLEGAHPVGTAVYLFRCKDRHFNLYDWCGYREWVGAKAGLGYLMLYANGTLQVSLVFAAILCLTLLGLGLFGLMTLLERYAMPWRRYQYNKSDVR